MWARSVLLHPAERSAMRRTFWFVCGDEGSIPSLIGTQLHVQLDQSSPSYRRHQLVDDGAAQVVVHEGAHLSIRSDRIGWWMGYELGP